MDKDLNTRKRKKSIDDASRNVKKSMKNGSGMVLDVQKTKQYTSTVFEPSLYMHQEDMLWCLYLGDFQNKHHRQIY